MCDQVFLRRKRVSGKVQYTLVSGVRTPAPLRHVLTLEQRPELTRLTCPLY